MKRMADRLPGDEYRWSVPGAGGAQMTFAATASQMGGNRRVGLEDSLFIGRGNLAESNAQQVTRIRRIVEDPGCEAVSPDEARDILGLKRGDQAAFWGNHASRRSFPTPKPRLTGFCSLARP